MIVTVHLHTILQYSPQGRLNQVELSLEEGATVGNVLDRLKIALEPEALILVINHHVADVQTPLKDGDRLDLVPAISGGARQDSGLRFIRRRL